MLMGVVEGVVTGGHYGCVTWRGAVVVVDYDDDYDDDYDSREGGHDGKMCDVKSHVRSHMESHIKCQPVKVNLSGTVEKRGVM